MGKGKRTTLKKCVGVRDHWVRLEQVYGNNYRMVNEVDDGDGGPALEATDVDEATCVVCGNKVMEDDCLARDF